MLKLETRPIYGMVGSGEVVRERANEGGAGSHGRETLEVGLQGATWSIGGREWSLVQVILYQRSLAGWDQVEVPNPSSKEQN